MRIAHLILTHKNPAQLERLLKALSHPAFDLYIHLDKKIDIQPFLYLAEKKNVFLVSNRATVYWAGYGTIQATLNGFREILATGNYGYVNVISAQDFPLRPAEDIHQFIIQRQGTEFITCESIEDQWSSAAPRVSNYHLINYRFLGKYRLEKCINFFFRKRKFPIENYKIVGRSNWFTITQAAARYLLDFIDGHPEVVRYFKYCWGADEFIFASVLYNSHFRENIRHNLVYVDWTGQTEGHPRILLTKDLPAITASGMLFARKMDMTVDNDIITFLEKRSTAPPVVTSAQRQEPLRTGRTPR